MRLSIQQIEITDTFGVQYQRFAPKSVTVIKGRNGSGKSSIIRSIAKVFEGGKSPDIIRKGAKKSVIKLTLSDSTEITKTTTAKTSTLEIIGPDGEPVNAPATYVAQLSESTAVDPAKILKLDAATEKGRKDLIALLLDLMPLSFDAAEVNAAFGPISFEHIEPGTLDLDGLDKLKDACVEKRRRLGVQARDAEGTVQSLRKSLPEQDTKDWSAAVLDAETAQATLEAQEKNELATVTTEARDERKKRHDEFARGEEKLRADFQRAMDALNAERTKSEEAINKAEREATSEIRDRYAVDKSRAASAVATARERHQAQLKAEGLRDSIEEWTRKMSNANGLYQRMTFALEELEKLKRAKLESLPVPGLEFSGDTVMVDGVPWQNVNLARRVEVAMQLSALRAGEVSLLLLDDAEHLDKETRRLLEQGIAESGFQLIEALVSDEGPLRIETVSHAAALK